MDTRVSPSIRSQNVSRGFSMTLTLAVLEWLLIFMLFIDATFSYLVTKFARYCELQVPCLLCSRLDHVLGNEKLRFYWDLICGNHKLEISSLVLCHVHNKLVDVHGTCENCLFSFATINKSNAETYRLLVGKMGADPHVGHDHDPFFEDRNCGSSGLRICSCCNEHWIPKGYAKNLLHTTSIGSLAAELDVPLSATIERNRDDLKKIEDESYAGKNDFDPLSHIEYKKVKITSDTESEVPFSDDDSARSLIHEAEDSKDDFTVQCEQLEPRIITLANDLTLEKLIYPGSASEPSVLESVMQQEAVDPHDSIATEAAIRHGLEELDWQKAEQKTDISSPSELISFDVVLPSSNVTATPVEVSLQTLDVRGAGEEGKKPVTESGDISKAENELIMTTETNLGVNPVTNDTGFQMPNYLDLGDAYKLATGNKGRQLSGKFSEQRSLKDSARVSEDLKVLLSQISAARGIELSLNDMSPRVSGNIDEFKTSDASSIGIQLLQKRFSLERNESNISLDGSTVSEIEGESVVDRLKRQVEHDKKLMGALYKELEEERNASAVATNQAMAMITRLQEEKAALHMEALQCLRVMEEQAEYDVEALQKSNDLLADKEREIQDLETELELYRKKIEDVSMLENIMEPACDLKDGDITVDHSGLICGKNCSSASYDSVDDKNNLHHRIDEADISFGNKNINTAKGSLLEFEDERLYILQCLKKLEKELHLFSNNGVYLDMANGAYSAEEENKGSDESNSRSQGNDGTEEGDMQKDVIIYRGSPRAQEGIVLSYENPQHISNESSEFDSGERRVDVVCRDTDLDALKEEFSNLSVRLEALEADQSFLEHSINSLRNGNDGLKFIQEIACHLRELHRIGIRRRHQPFA